MHRLFSNFARGWPGVGLLLIRMVAGVSLIIHGLQTFQVGETPASLVLSLLAIGDGALLLAGLWTPIAGILVIGIAIGQTIIHHENPYPAILLATIGAALALVGPGALSIDAWLFGWRRIDIGN